MPRPSLSDRVNVHPARQRRFEWSLCAARFGDPKKRANAGKEMDAPTGLLEDLLRSPVDAIVTIDGAGRILFFNPGAEKIFGYARAEVEGKSLDVLLPEQFHASHRRHIRAFEQSGASAREMGARQDVYGRRKNGETFRANASIYRHASDKGVAFTAVLRDASASPLFGEVADHLRLALAAAGIGFFAYDHERGKLEVSPTWRAIFGVEDLTIDSERFMQLIDPADRAELAANIARVQDPSTKGAVAVEHRIMRPDGAVRWVAATAQTQFIEEGGVRRPRHTIGVVRDVTERKQAQDVLASANERLEASVAERTRELRAEMKRRDDMQAAVAEAQRLEAIGRLTGGVAHDTNNMLTVIGGNLEMLEDALAKHQSVKYLREAQAAVQRMTQLNRRLLTVARRRKLDARVLDLNDQVKSMGEMLRSVLGETITLTTTLHADLWKVSLDAGELDNALLNLAINARDAMPRGGRLHISTKNVEIDEEAARGEADLAPGKYVSISVTDSGNGIPAEILPRVFEPFFTTKAQGKGTGLGLATVHGFTKQSGGHVAIYSEPGRGTTVNIYFPRHDGAAVSAGDGQQPARGPANGGGETILVVEDDAQVRAITCARLERLGYRALEAANGPSALALLERGERVDLVFSDIAMPGGMSGFDLMGALEARAAHIPVVLTSGFDLDAVRNGERQFSAKVLQKPYSQHDLVRAVRAALARE
jgi:PAS domain S-box-containing protein